MKSGHVVIHLLRPDAISPEFARERITPEERVRADRFHFAEDASRWTSFRAQLRVILGKALSLSPLDVPLILSEQGKPLLAPPYDEIHFNLSHCADLAVVALSPDGPVGVDLESLDRAQDLPGCEASFCHPEEIAMLPQGDEERMMRLLEIWTAKEAVLKALGTGLTHPPEVVRVDLTSPVGLASSDSPLAGIQNQRILVLKHSRLIDYRAVVSVLCSIEFIEII
ncbi:MAG: 4'-phosphopantetheinyl transferase superfamily protein [Luteolibacter sp.]|uniref:4'-phosphopantetheinyl transferase family protein n=1 Tax=Luteolibacter sp. TaxID=1962973 RepID=UPI0032666C87